MSAPRHVSHDEVVVDMLKADPEMAEMAREEIAAAAVYLSSNEAAYVTGQTLHVNGGMAMI